MIIIVPLEKLDNRYTEHWYNYIPKQLENYVGEPVKIVEGEGLSNKTSEGAFLNWSSTVYYKHIQSAVISRLFYNGHIKNGDVFFYTDAWNTTSLDLRYMADLCGIDIKICGIWHAGSYDDHDILGMKIKNRRWSQCLERAMYENYDMNFVASYHHKKMFCDILEIEIPYKLEVVGFPMEYYKEMDFTYDVSKKKNKIVFPHRISPDKQPEVFENLSRLLPEYEFVFTQKLNLDKQSYYNLLKESKIVFSSSLHENLGIGTFEACMCGCIPVLPNRLSYREMYDTTFIYHNIDEAARMIKNFIENYEKYLIKLNKNVQSIQRIYFTGEQMYKSIKSLIAKE